MVFKTVDLAVLVIVACVIIMTIALGTLAWGWLRRTGVELASDAKQPRAQG